MNSRKKIAIASLYSKNPKSFYLTVIVISSEITGG